MEKKKLLILLFTLLIFIVNNASAETIILKSGKTVEGKILERTSKKVVVDVFGVQVSYFFNEIESIVEETVKVVNNENKLVDWGTWENSIKDYLGEVTAIAEVCESVGWQYNKEFMLAVQKGDSEGATKITTDFVKLYTGCVEKLELMHAPEELLEYHKKSTEYYKYEEMGVEALLRRDKAAINYRKMAKTSQIQSTEELVRVYIKHNAPEATINKLKTQIINYKRQLDT